MKRLNKLILAGTWGIALSVLVAGIAHASTIYDVNRAIGVGSVVGTVETDGTLGVLGGANFLDWTLTVDDGTGPFTLFGPLSGNNSALLITGSSFTATLTDLLFDFSNATGDIALFQNPNIGSGINFWCMDGTSDGCSGNSSAETVTSSGPFATVFASRSGIVSVATTAISVPEPATLLLFGAGLAGLAVISRRRKAKA